MAQYLTCRFLKSPIRNINFNSTACSIRMTSNFHLGLLKDISLMLSADDYNVIIQVGETNNSKEFHAHSNILRARSPYFKSIFSSDDIKKENNVITLCKPNITPTVFEMILG